MSSNASLDSQLPNPFTPMAFLPPELAFQVTVSTYILVGSLVALIWDVLNNLSGDYKLLTKYRVGIPTFTYYLSRISSIGYLLGGAIFATAPLGNCKTSGKIISWMYPIAIPSTSMLFFFRVRAMYNDNRYMVGFFSLMWLAVLGGSLTETQGVTAANIGTSKYCTNSEMKSYVSIAGIIPFANDTLIFFAITWRLMQIGLPYVDHKISVKNLKVILFGKHLSAFTRGLLQDGQIYYLSTVVINVMNVIIFYNDSIPVVYRTSLTMPNITLMNVMACRVYRRTKFGIYRESSTQESAQADSGCDQVVITPIAFHREMTQRSSTSERVLTSLNDIEAGKEKYSKEKGSHVDGLVMV